MDSVWIQDLEGTLELTPLPGSLNPLSAKQPLASHRTAKVWRHALNAACGLSETKVLPSVD